MPPPATYVDITSDSFTYPVSVAEFNVANEIWFRMVTGADPVMFGWHTGSATGFTPLTRLYQSDGTTLIDGVTGSITFTYPLANTSTYYIRITKNGGGSILTGFNTLFEWIPVGMGTIPYGSIVINDDQTYTGTTGFPSAVYGPDGEFLGFLGTIPAGEIGDALPNGVSLWHDRYGMYGGQLALFAADYSFIDEFTPTPPLLTGEALFPNIANNGTHFYVVDRGNTGNVYVVDPVAVTISAAIATPTASGQVSAIGVTRDGSTLYWAEGFYNNLIQAWDLNTDTSLGTFYTIPDLGANYSVATTGVNDHPGEILVLLDGTVVTYVHDFSNDLDRVIHLAAGGSLLNDIAFDTNGEPGIIDHIHYSPTGPGYLRVWFFTNSGAAVGRYGDLNLTTGVLSTLVLTPLMNDGESLVPGDGTIFAPSASCSMVTSSYGGGGTIIVTKVTVPSSDATAFTVTAGGGLDPASFTLAHGESETFLDVTPGSGYSLTEAVDSGLWTVAYEVSNSSPVDNITVAADETVTVTITNTGATVTDPIRWLRRAPVMSDENIRLFHSQFTLDMQTGMGLVTGQGRDPQVMLRYSDDSGQTWSEEHWRGSGQIGEYRRRVIWRRLGVSRLRVYELVGSDPVITALIDGFTDVAKGSN